MSRNVSAPKRTSLSAGTAALLLVQAPTLLVPTTIAHLAPSEYGLAIAALNLLTLLTAFDFGAGILISSRRSLPTPDDTAVIAAAGAITLVPPLGGALIVCAVPSLREWAGLGDGSLGLVWMVALAAGFRSWLYLAIISAGTAERPRCQVTGGVLFAGASLAGTGIAVWAGAEPATAAAAAYATAGAAGLVGVLGDSCVRRLLVDSLRMRRSAVHIARSMLGFSASRSLVQGSSAGFTFVERVAAVARLSPTGLIAYDLAARVMSLPRQVAAAAGPTLVHEFAAAPCGDGALRARTLTRSTVAAFAAAVPATVAVIALISPPPQRWLAVQVAIVLAAGQAVLVSTLASTARLNSKRRVLPEAVMHVGALCLLGTLLATVHPSTPLGLAGVVAGVGVLAYGTFLVMADRIAPQ